MKEKLKVMASMAMRPEDGSSSSGLGQPSKVKHASNLREMSFFEASQSSDRS